MAKLEKTLILPSPRELVRIMEAHRLPRQIIEHEKAVAREAIKLAKKIRSHEVNIELVKVGALAHDLGRCLSHGFKHGVLGGKILRELGFSEELARIAECHVLAGLSPEEAESCGLEREDYRPHSLEEKIVCLADKYCCGKKRISVKGRFQRWFERFGHTELLMEQFNRALDLEHEIRQLIDS